MSRLGEAPKGTRPGAAAAHVAWHTLRHTHAGGKYRSQRPAGAAAPVLGWAGGNGSGAPAGERIIVRALMD